ncbi:formate hydrogenlyase, partial [Salmonella enterica subsp. enterica serovar Infantis]
VRNTAQSAMISAITTIARASKRKRELTFNTDFGDLTLFQQAQSGDA